MCVILSAKISNVENSSMTDKESISIHHYYFLYVQAELCVWEQGGLVSGH